MKGSSALFIDAFGFWESADGVVNILNVCFDEDGKQGNEVH